MPRHAGIRRFGFVLFPLLMLIPMARFPNATEKRVVLTGDTATSVASLLGLSSPGKVLLPLSRRDGWAVYLLKKDTPETLLNDNNQQAPTRHNVVEFSNTPSPSLSISPYWLDLQTGSPSRPGYAFNSPFFPNKPEPGPWWLLLQQLKKEIPPAQWSEMEKGGRLSVQRCFPFAETWELCLEVYCAKDRQPPQDGWQIQLSVRDTRLPTPEQLFSQLRADAERGEVEAQYRLGLEHMPMEGGGGAALPGPESAAFWFRKAAGQGHWGAQLQLSRLYAQGKGLAEDGEKALFWLGKAVEQKEAQAPLLQTLKDLQKEVQLRVDAERGLAQAQHKLGYNHMNGTGLAQLEPALAAFWFHKAAKQGHAEAQLQLGLCFLNGKGLPQELSQALLWLHKAAEQGNKSAFFQLGQVYSYAKHLDADGSQALLWLHKAAEQGDKEAMLYLAQLHEYGLLGFPKDETLAASWFEKAARQGDATALVRLNHLRQRINTQEKPKP